MGRNEYRTSVGNQGIGAGTGCYGWNASSNIHVKFNFHHSVTNVKPSRALMNGVVDIRGVDWLARQRLCLGLTPPCLLPGTHILLACVAFYYTMTQPENPHEIQFIDLELPNLQYHELHELPLFIMYPICASCHGKTKCA